MKIKNNNQGIAHIGAILAVLVVVAVGLVGWKVWDSRDKKADDKPSTTKTKIHSGTAPTSQSKKNKNIQDCFYESDIRNNKEPELFTSASDTYTYKNTSSGLEFSYPKRWGAVAIENDQPICVGPMRISVAKVNDFAEGDGALLTARNGYFKKDGKYYDNWFKDDKNGPYEIKPSDYEIFEEVNTLNTKALVTAILCKETVDNGCYQEASINLTKAPYQGFGVATIRPNKETMAASLKQEMKIDSSYVNKNDYQAKYNFKQVVDELTTFVKTIKVTK